MKFPNSTLLSYPIAGDVTTHYFVKTFEDNDLADVEEAVNLWLFQPLLDISQSPYFHFLGSELTVVGAGNNKTYIMNLNMMMIGGDYGDWNP